MSSLALVATGARWAEIVALATVIGALAIELFVLPQDVAVLESVRRRLRRYVLCGSGVLALASLAALGLRAQAMTAGGIDVTLSAVPVVIRQTHFGTIWLARVAVLVALFVTSLGHTRRLRTAALGCAAAIAVTAVLTGHAATWGDVTPTVAVNAVHIVAATAWTGGLLMLAVLLPTEAAALAGPVLRVVATRFSTLAAACLAAVVVTGGYNAVVQMGSASALIGSAYGRVLLVKLAVFAALVSLGAWNRFRVVPALQGPPAYAAAGRLARYVGYESLLALLVFGSTAVLAELPPGRHAAHLTGHGYHDDAQHGEHGR